MSRDRLQSEIDDLDNEINYLERKIDELGIKTQKKNSNIFTNSIIALTGQLDNYRDRNLEEWDRQFREYSRELNNLKDRKREKQRELESLGWQKY